MDSSSFSSRGGLLFLFGGGGRRWWWPGGTERCDVPYQPVMERHSYGPLCVVSLFFFEVVELLSPLSPLLPSCNKEILAQDTRCHWVEQDRRVFKRKSLFFLKGEPTAKAFLKEKKNGLGYSRTRQSDSFALTLTFPKRSITFFPSRPFTSSLSSCLEACRQVVNRLKNTASYTGNLFLFKKEEKDLFYTIPPALLLSSCR